MQTSTIEKDLSLIGTTVWIEFQFISFHSSLYLIEACLLYIHGPIRLNCIGEIELGISHLLLAPILNPLVITSG